jgi:TRAP-type C4-dicarboxylate transport system permease small subunit
MPRLLQRAVDGLVTLSAVAGSVALIVIVATVLVDVAGRYFGSPLYGAQDIVQMASVFVVFGGMAFCERRGGHIQVDLLERAFSDRTNRVLLVVGCVAGAVVFALIAWRMWEASKLARMLNMATNILGLPRAPFQYAVIALSGVASAGLALKAVVLARGRA